MWTHADWKTWQVFVARSPAVKARALLALCSCGSTFILFNVVFPSPNPFSIPPFTMFKRTPSSTPTTHPDIKNEPRLALHNAALPAFDNKTRQHELEDSLGAERHSMHRLMDNFNAVADEQRMRPTPRGKSISIALSEAGVGTAKRGMRHDDSSSPPRGGRRRFHGTDAERTLFKTMDVYPIPPVHEYGAEAKTEPTPRRNGENNAISATKRAKRAIGRDGSSSLPRGERRRYRGRKAERVHVNSMDAYPIPPVHEYGAEAKTAPTPRSKRKKNSLSATKTAQRAIGHDGSSSSPRGRRRRGRDAERTLVKRMDAYPIPPVREHSADAKKTEMLLTSSSTAWSTPRQNAAKEAVPRKPSPVRGKTEAASFVPKPPRPQPSQGQQLTTAAAAGGGTGGRAAAGGAGGAAEVSIISISGRRVKQMQVEKLRQQQQEQQEQQRRSKREVRARRKAKERARKMDRRRKGGGTEVGEQPGSTNDEDSDENESGGGLNGGGRAGRRTRKSLPPGRQPTKPKPASLRGTADGKMRGGADGKERSTEPGRLKEDGRADGGALPPEIEVIWNDDESYEEAVARAMEKRANKMRLEAEAEEALGVGSKDHEQHQQQQGQGQDNPDISSHPQDQDGHDTGSQYGGDDFEDDGSAPTPPR